MDEKSPDRRLVLPATRMKIGPLLSSSHLRQSFNLHSGNAVLLCAKVSFKQVSMHLSRVWYPVQQMLKING
jgi:hypothetical protein